MCCSINRDQSVNSNLSASKLSTGLIDDASFREWKPLHPRAAMPVSNICGGFSKLKGDRQQTESQLHVERKQTSQAEDKMQSYILRLEAERNDALRNVSDVETALLDYRKDLAQTLQQKEQREEELVMQVQMLKGENQALRDKCWRIEGSKGELDHEKEKLDRLRGILSEAQRTLERDRREVDCARQTLEHEKDKCQQDGLTLQRNKEHLNVDKQRLNEMIQKLESEQQNLDCTRIAVETRQSDINEERKLLDTETTSLHKERMALDALREDLNENMAKLEMEKKYAEEERASLHNMRLQVDHQKEEQNEESSRCAEECAELEIGWKRLEKERKALESEIERHRECWGLGRELATFAERNLSGIETFLAHFVHNMSLTGPQSTKLMSWLKEARREQTANVTELEERLSEVVSQLQCKETEIGKLEKELHETTEAYVRDKEALHSAEQVVTNLRSENDFQKQELHELKGRMEVLRERTEAAETDAQCHKKELSHQCEVSQIRGLFRMMMYEVVR
uniref:Uncharacterized protein n=1 Tax=Eptatretus burgeri TaxID=7764 RepID=A0A8C4NGW8_EPTBU